MGDGTGSGGSSLTSDRSGYLLTSIPTTLSGEDEGTKLSGVSRSAPCSCILRGGEIRVGIWARPPRGLPAPAPPVHACDLTVTAQRRQREKPQIQFRPNRKSLGKK